MSDIRLDPLTGDLDVTNNGLNLTPDDTDALAQSLTIRLRFFLNEWKYNTAEGVDYYGQIFIKGQSEAIIDRVLQERILTTIGVQSIVDYNSDIDPRTRRATISFTVKKDDGVSLTVSNLEL